jgi:hypothetical protein
MSAAIGLLWGAMLFGAIGVFASEVSQLGVPGIWFPYGVGVSRTEYTYLAFDIALFVYLLSPPLAFCSAARLGGLSVLLRDGAEPMRMRRLRPFAGPLPGSGHDGEIFLPFICSE